MLIKNIKEGTYVTIKVKPNKFIENGEITNREGKKVKLSRWECEDEEEEKIVVTFFGEENMNRIDDNIGQWVILNKFKVDSYEGVLNMNSSLYGFVKKEKNYQQLGEGVEN